MDFLSDEKPTDTTCPKCGGFGRVYPGPDAESPMETRACDACVARHPSETIKIDNDGIDLRSTGYGLTTFSVGSGHDSVEVNPAEARSIAAALIAWADKVESK